MEEEEVVLLGIAGVIMHFLPICNKGVEIGIGNRLREFK